MTTTSVISCCNHIGILSQNTMMLHFKKNRNREEGQFFSQRRTVWGVIGLALCWLLMSETLISAAPVVKISGLTPLSKRAYKVVSSREGGIRSGSRVYIDREYTFTSVPRIIQGSTYILTANDDKFDRSSLFLSFYVNTPVIVYVAHDDRHKIRPSWLTNAFQPTGERLHVGKTSQPYTMSLFKKEYPAGVINLGGNYPTRDVGNWGMYSVIVRGKM